MLRFNKSSGPSVRAHGVEYRKVASTWLWQVSEPFSVDTSSGVQEGKAGDFLAYDEKSGDVWPVSAEYVAMNYEKV